MDDAPTTPAQPGGRFPAELPAPFGPYRVLRLLGKGGMGSVFLAHDSQLDRSVALKIPLLETGGDSQILARFYREAQSAAALRHPYICGIYEVGAVDGIPYLAMAFIEGNSLAQHIRAQPLAPRQAAMLVRKLSLALQEAHTHGIIHRDLKPANIMINLRGEPIIMDFGLARRLRRDDTRLTQLGTLLGTPAYMAPEQISGDLGPIGPAADIYSLGVILYELLAGRLPFTGEIMALLAHVLMDEPAPPSQHRTDLDAGLEAICLKAMAKKAPDRHSSMGELASELTDYLRGAITSSLPSSSPPVAPDREAESETQRIPQSQNTPIRSAPEVGVEKPLTPRSTRLRRKRRKKRGVLASRWLWLGAGAGVLLLALLMGLVLRHSRFRAMTNNAAGPAGPNHDLNGRLEQNPSTPDPADLKKTQGKQEPATPEPTDLERMQGEWVVAALIGRGVGASPGTLATVRVTIAGSTMTLTGLGPEQKKTIKIDATRSPRQFDTLSLTGPDRGKTVFGIHELTDQRLRICSASIEKPVRPTSFYSTLENKQELIVLEREHAPAPRQREPVLSPGEIWRIPWRGNHLYHTAFSPRGRHFLAGGDTGTLRIWEVNSGRQIGRELPFTVGLFTPDGLQVVGHTYKTVVYVIDLTGKTPRTLKLGKTIASLAISPDGRQIACGHADKTIRLWNLATGEEIRAFSGHSGTVGVCFSPSGKNLISASSVDKTVRLWDVESGKQVRSFDDFKDVAAIPGTDLIVQGMFAGEGRLAAYVWGKEKTLILWDAATGAKLGQLGLGTDHSKDLTISPDGRWMLTAHEDRTVRLRDVTTGKELHRFAMADVNVPRSPSFSPDGRFALAGSHRSWVYLWQLKR